MRLIGCGVVWLAVVWCGWLLCGVVGCGVVLAGCFTSQQHGRFTMKVVRVATLR